MTGSSSSSLLSFSPPRLLMPPYSRIEERPSEMTNVAISISSDVSFLAFLFSPFSPFLRTRERSKKRERNDREIGRGIHRSGWSKIRGRAWNSDVYRVRGGEGGGAASASAFTSVSLGWKRPTRNIVGFRLGAILR